MQDEKINVSNFLLYSTVFFHLIIVNDNKMCLHEYFE